MVRQPNIRNDVIVVLVVEVRAYYMQFLTSETSQSHLVLFLHIQSQVIVCSSEPGLVTRKKFLNRAYTSYMSESDGMNSQEGVHNDLREGGKVNGNLRKLL